MIVDYILAKECKNEEVWYTCYKCGKCGRVFENGYLIDDGGTTIEEEEEGLTRKSKRYWTDAMVVSDGCRYTWTQRKIIC